MGVMIIWYRPARVSPRLIRRLQPILKITPAEDAILLAHFLLFYWNLWNSRIVSQYYRQEFVYPSDHHYYRRYTSRYKKKIAIVKNIWMTAGVTLAVFPYLPLFITLVMLTTFISFSVLDETE